jgi:hypothetical protein
MIEINKNSSESGSGFLIDREYTDEDAYNTTYINEEIL